jgi:hypothetical protein
VSQRFVIGPFLQSVTLPPFHNEAATTVWLLLVILLTHQHRSQVQRTRPVCNSLSVFHPPETVSNLKNVDTSMTTQSKALVVLITRKVGLLAYFWSIRNYHISDYHLTPCRILIGLHIRSRTSEQSLVSMYFFHSFGMHVLKFHEYYSLNHVSCLVLYFVCLYVFILFPSFARTCFTIGVWAIE